MIDRLFAAHPVLTVLLIASLLGLIGYIELKVGKSPGNAYLTWGLTIFSLVCFFVIRLLS